LLLPIAIRFDLIDEGGPLLTPMPDKITLTVSVQIQSADAAAAMHWILPNPSVHSSAFPLDVARKSEVRR
jgi:hypothetical protein